MLSNFCVLFLFIRISLGFYVAGVFPNEYSKSSNVSVTAVKLYSSITQLPYEYYYMPVCKPPSGVITYEPLNFGEILLGDKTTVTGFQIKMLEDFSCKILCPIASLTAKEANTFLHLIKHEYTAHINVDNLPASVPSLKEPNQYKLGYDIGFLLNNNVYINNHLHFHIKYHKVKDDKYRVVGVKITPKSCEESSYDINDKNECVLNLHQTNKKLSGDSANTIIFTYGVTWIKSDIKWASRWDVYLNVVDGQIHWFSIINSIITIIFLTSVMSVIILRTLRKDIASYNRDEDSEEIIEESGWKLVHGDVFRPPRRSHLLAAFLGSGVQLLCMTIIVLFFAMLGMLSPASRGALLSAGVFTYVFMGSIAGYFSGRIYKTMHGYNWKMTSILTGILFPAIVLGSGLIINMFLLAKSSSAALPFTTILGILSLWLLVSLPLVSAGFFFGYRKKSYEQPVRTNQIPRGIPERKSHQNLIITTLVSGLLPFGSVFIELFFIYNAIWNRQVYYLFGFLFVVFILLVISCAQVAIVVVYLQLCSEDYHWWWRSVISSGGSAIYVLIYSVYYFATKLEITSFVSTIIYFGYSLLIVVAFWILTGTIGFFASFVFIQKIYSAIKID